MDVVQRVHEEVRVYLILQIFQFGLEVVAFQLLHGFLVTQGLEEKLHRNVEAQHQQGYHHTSEERTAHQWKEEGASPLVPTLEVVALAEIVRFTSVTQKHIPVRTVGTVGKIAVLGTTVETGRGY